MIKEADNKVSPSVSRMRLLSARKELPMLHLSIRAKSRRELRYGKPSMVQARIVRVEALLEIKAR